MKKSAFYFLIFTSLTLIFISPFLYSQKKAFLYRKCPYIQKDSLNLKKQKMELAISAVDLTKYLPNNFVKDATVDYTECIQRGFDENKIVKMPNFQLLVNQKGLNVKSGSRIIFQKESSIVMKPNSLSNYGILKIFNVSDIKIYSPVIIGDRNTHIGDKGEWGMGLYILGAKNIQIINPIINNCWGDGIYIGKGNNGGCTNVKVVNGVIDYCRRNGISITDGDSIEIINPIISNTQGTLPMCGIDIEPNNNKALEDNIHILNPKTFNNSSAGIEIYLKYLFGQEKKNVDIKIYNHIDNGSDIGLSLGGCDDVNKLYQPLSGSIDIIKPQWKNNRVSISVDKNTIGPKINFESMRIENTNENFERVRIDLLKKENVFVK